VVVDSARVIHVAAYDATLGRGVHLRLDENGNFLDQTTDPLASTQYNAIAVDASDNIYFAGSMGANSAQAYLRWGGVGGTSLGGHTEVYSGSGHAEWRDAKIDSQGRIVVAGQTWTSTVEHTTLFRYLPAGGYDLSKVDTTNDQAAGVTVTANDNIYVSGRNEISDTSSIIGSTATFTGWTAAGGSLFTVQIMNKSTCPSPGGYTNGWSGTVDGTGGLWFLGEHCDYQPILREYDPTTGALLINADYMIAGIGINAQVRSDGTSLAVVGDGTWSSGVPSGFLLYDADLQGVMLRKFQYAVHDADGLNGVAFIGHDRIVVGSSRASSSTSSQIWVARIRAP